MMRSLILSAGLVGMFVAQPTGVRAQSPPPGTVTVTVPGSASGAITGLIAQVIVTGKTVSASGLQAALATAGVTNIVEDETALSGMPNAVGLRGVVPGTAPADIESVRRAVEAYVGKNKDAIVLRVRYFGLAVDCTPIAAKARDAALAQARDRAQQLATASGVRIGDVVSVAETQGCPPPGRLGGSYAVDTATMQMRVPVSETVTYAVVHT